MLAGRLVVSVLVVGGFAACGDDGKSNPGDGGGSDAVADAPFVPVDIDNGSCGDQVRFTGEYVDWDSDTSFCGINNAVFEVAGGGAMDATAPNGRFDLCLPDQATVRVDITQPTGASGCPSAPGTYTINALVLANRQVIQAGGFYSARAFTAARQATFFQSFVGAPLDPAKAQVLVHVDGATRAVSITAAHGATQAVINGTVSFAWGTGDTGTDVFFPNVDVGAGTTDVSVAGGGLGTGPIPLVANTNPKVTIKTPPQNQKQVERGTHVPTSQATTPRGRQSNKILRRGE